MEILVGLILGLIGIGLAELSYVYIKRYDIEGFYWQEIEDEDNDM